MNNSISKVIVYKIEDNLKNLINEKDTEIKEMNVKITKQENIINKNNNEIKILNQKILEITNKLNNEIKSKDNIINELKNKISFQEKEIKNLINDKINTINKSINKIDNEMKNNYEKIKSEQEKNSLNLNKKNEELKKMINNIEIKIENKPNNGGSVNLENAVLFKGRCPCKYCRCSGEINQFKCPKCSSNEYINVSGKIICPICGEKEFIWKKKLQCGKNDNNFHEISYQGILIFLSSMGSISNPPTGFLKKLTREILMHEDEFLSE
jgi:uncharacterized coiled-coil protein SlyX